MPVIETNKVIAIGQKEFFETMDFNFDPDFLRIVDVHTWIEVYHTKVISNNIVIFNAYLYKNIIYKEKQSVEPNCKASDVTMKGYVKYHESRKKIEGFIPVELLNAAEPIDLNTDKAIVLCAEVLGEVEEPLGKNKIYEENGKKIDPAIYTYYHLHEKVVYTIRVKVVRDTMLTVDGTVFADPGCITTC